MAVGVVAAGAGGSLGIFLLMKAYAGGSTAMTGVEAISNGVPAFQRPESKNAATTLAMMGGLAVSIDGEVLREDGSVMRGNNHKRQSKMTRSDTHR